MKSQTCKCRKVSSDIFLFHRKITRRNRRGMAALEFVIGFPFLLFIFAAIYAVSWAGVNRTRVIHQSRHQVWKMRSEDGEHDLAKLNRNDNAMPLSVPIPTKTVKSLLPDNVNQNNSTEPENMPGEIWGTSSREFGTYSWMGGNRTAESETGLLYWTWDHEELPLSGMQPHVFEVIYKMSGVNSDGFGQSELQGDDGIGSLFQF